MHGVDRRLLLIVAVFDHQRFGLLQDRGQLVERAVRVRVERVGRGKQADDGEHDEPDALLPVVRPVGEADTGAGQNQNSAHPPDRWAVSGRLVQVLVMNRLAGEKVQPTRQRKAEDR
jgi:hypothetical protein